MGFPSEEASLALLSTDNDLDKALNLLFSGGVEGSSASSTPKKKEGEKEEEGGDATSKEGRLSLSSSSGGRSRTAVNLDEELAEELQKQEAELMGKRKEGIEEKASVLSNSNTNLFIGLIAYIR